MRLYITLLIITLSSVCLSAQGDALKKANEFYKSGDYQNALLELGKIPQTNTSGPLTFKKAICHYQLNHLDKAIAELNKSENMGYSTDEMSYYKGRMMHHKGHFDQAVKAYKEYLKSIDNDHPKRDEVRDHIRHAGAARDIIYLDPIATIENAGREINSYHNESQFIQSSGKSNRYYFNSDKSDKAEKVSEYLGESFDLNQSEDYDIHYVETDGESWESSKKLEDRSVNTYKNDGLMGISVDGNAIYVLRGKEGDDEKNYELVAQNGSARMKMRVKALAQMIGSTSEYHFFNDSTVIFASDQMGGEGGYDLFATAYANGSWLAPKNLGSTINSESDERSPYLSNDGGMLFFSSNRRMSVGGLDVFKAYYLFEQKKWTLPRNLGLPINSPGNEMDFRLSNDGLIGTYTSDRKDGYGGTDIYFAFLNEKEDHQSFKVKNIGFIDYPEFYIDKIELPIEEEPKEEIVAAQPKPIEVKHVPIRTEISSILIPILAPNQDAELLTKQNLEKLDILADQIIRAGIKNLEIMSFTDKEGIAEYNLFLSIRNAEKIKEELVSRGVSSDILHLKGLGNYLPIIKPGLDKPSVSVLNNRIQFKVNFQPENLEVEYASLDVDKSYISRNFEIYQTLIDEVVSYKIQIATVRQMYRGTALKLYNDVQVEKDETTGNYLYTVGLYDNFLEANSVMRELKIISGL